MLVAADRKMLIMPHRADVENILNGTARRFTHKGKTLLALPHEIPVVKLLRNMNICAPAPILSYYDWAGDKPFESQKTTAAMLTMNRRAYVLSSMGVGKTRAVLYAYDYLRKIGRARRMLVVAPLSTLMMVWEREIFSTFEGMDAVVLHGTRVQRLARLREDHDVYIINHDGVKVIEHALRAKNFDVVAVDELAAYRNVTTDRWKRLQGIVKDVPYAWGLTGAPTPNGPTDAYGQVKLLTPTNVPMSFRNFQQGTMMQITPFKWIPRKHANDVVHKAMQPSVRYALDECHDLPPVTYSDREIAMNRAQTRAYKQLMDQYAMEVRDKKISVVNEGARLNKLLQVGCGFAYDQDGKGIYLDARARLRLVLDLISESEGKVIVFAPFKFAVRMLHKAIGTRYTVEMVTGATSKNERDRIFTEFVRARDPRVIVAHPGCMSHGLTLVQATNIIWYSPTHSYETYEQANARIHRPGQTRHCHIVHVQCGTVEKRVYTRLKARQKVQGVLLDMFQKQETDHATCG